MLIDAHAHVLPRELPDRAGFPAMDAVAGTDIRVLRWGDTAFRAQAAFFDAARRLDALDTHGIGAEIVSPMPPLLKYTMGPQDARILFRHINDSVAEYVQAGHGRIHGLGAVPLQDPDLAAGELGAIADSGLRGVEVASQVNGHPIGDPRFTDFFGEAARLGLGVFVHTLPRADETGLAAHLRGSIGVGIEAARAAASLALGPTARVCPPGRVLFSHAAGGLPLMLPRADHFWAGQDEASRAPEPPSSALRRFLVDSMVFDPRALRYAADYLGADALVVGTDFPAMERPESPAAELAELALVPAERDAVAFGNAQRFLGMDSAVPAAPTASAAPAPHTSAGPAAGGPGKHARAEEA